MINTSNAGDGWTQAELEKTTPLSIAELKQIKAGDIVLRLLAGSVAMGLRVQSVDDELIDCGWKFRRDTGAEVDEDLGWDGVTRTGSFITAFMRK